MRPTVSVIVPTWDRPVLLGQALASIAAQDCGIAEVEAIVINDGGPDVSGQLAAARERGLQVRSIELSSHVGVAAARNAGLAAARGENLAFLDDDDVFLPTHLRLMLTALEAGSSPPCGGAYGTTVVSSTRVDHAAPVLTERYAFSYPFSADFLAVCSYLPICAPVVRRIRVGSSQFDTRLDNLEDWDMWLRLVRERGLVMNHIDVASAVYHRIPSQPSLTAAASSPGGHQRFARSLWRIWRRWPASTDKVTRYRRYLIEGYMAAVRGLADGQTLPMDYFHHCLRAMSDAWHGQMPEAALVDRIAAGYDQPEQHKHITGSAQAPGECLILTSEEPPP
jgi:glycosyltransferase involved in cell wall biosynthesis